jgi:hypothetical protein
MRSILGFAVSFILVGAGLPGFGQTCTGLCLQQVSCPNGGTTSISGTVYTPNGTDPLPNALVYIPNAPVDAFTPGVSCPVAGAPPSGSPLVGTTTAVDGTFTITNVPVGTNIPLVVVSGRWRRQVVVPTTTACTNTAFSTRMPQNQSEGDIPRIAIATGSSDQVECVLRKVGISDSEFTDPTGTGRINLYLGQNSPGAQASSSTPSETALMGTSATTNQYDVIMLPCQGTPKDSNTADELQNFVNFANSGGRVYSSHYSYDYMYQNPNLPSVANWHVGQAQLPDGTATVDTSFSAGATLAQWLQLVGATTTQGQMQISTLRHDLDGVIAPTQSWLTLNDASAGNPVMQFVYNAPVGAANQCGRVLFNEYHVENPANSPAGKTFPAECSNAAMTPQEKLLEYSLFELTNDGGAPTLTPTSANFGNVALGFTSAAQVFTWTNNSTFPATATPSTSGPYTVAASNCANVQGGASCTISVVFTPTALGTQTGTLTVNSTGPATSASLTGVGVPALVFSATSLQFGSHDVGSTTTQTVTVTNNASGSVATPAILTTGDYVASSNCGGAIAASTNCLISVAFTPTATGDRPGTLTIGGYAPITLDGNGVDFTIALLPTSGKVEAGLSVVTKVTETPIAGFAATLTQTCTTTAPATTCTVTATVNPTSAVTTDVTIQTTPEYVIVGYSGFGARGWLWIVGAVSGLMLLATRRRAARVVLALLMVCALGGVSGCAGKQPAKNAVYTPAGSYTVTVSATDGFLVHSASYSLTVTAP